MMRFSEIPENDRQHFTRCAVCESYFDMRDLSQVVDHEHWPETPEVFFSHSSKKGNEAEVYIKGSRGMITLRQKRKGLWEQLPRKI